MNEWRFLYDPDSDSWEIVSNQAFSTKKDAEDYITEKFNAKPTDEVVR